MSDHMNSYKNSYIFICMCVLTVVWSSSSQKIPYFNWGFFLLFLKFLLAYLCNIKVVFTHKFSSLFPMQHFLEFYCKTSAHQRTGFLVIWTFGKEKVLKLHRLWDQHCCGTISICQPITPVFLIYNPVFGLMFNVTWKDIVLWQKWAWLSLIFAVFYTFDIMFLSNTFILYESRVLYEDGTLSREL